VTAKVKLKWERVARPWRQATASRDRTARVWDIFTRREVAKLEVGPIRIARHFMRFQLTQETRVYNVEDDEADMICYGLSDNDLHVMCSI
jgi:hypothetical protein